MAKSMDFGDHVGAGLWELECRRRIGMGGGLYFHRPRHEVVLAWQKQGFITGSSVGKLFADKRSAIAAIARGWMARSMRTAGCVGSTNVQASLCRRI